MTDHQQNLKHKLSWKYPEHDRSFIKEASGASEEFCKWPSNDISGEGGRASWVELEIIATELAGEEDH